MRFFRLFALSLVVLIGSVSADGGKIVVGDAVAGQQKYDQICASCHGIAGNSTVPSQPIIAGQHAAYTEEQLKHYASGERKNPLMNAILISLSETDFSNIAVYLSQQRAGLSGATSQQDAANGELLYRNGRATDSIPSCTGCHGSAGAGILPTYPRLSGQHATYTTTTLTEFRDGVRVNEVMNQIAAKMTDEDIASLAEYISGLH